MASAQAVLAILRVWYEQVPESEQSESNATCRLRQAMLDVSPVDYQFAYEELRRFKNLELDLANRRELLSRLACSAPAWASAIENRLAQHTEPHPPGDPTLLGNGGSFTTS